MGSSNIVQKSIGWSLFSEIAAKFVTPITNMLLARILVPDDFGVLAICNMLVSFVDIITDAGFGKYLVQHDFSSEDEKRDYADVAFWSNLAISAFMVILIVIFRRPVAKLLGNEKYSTVISIASIQLIFTSLSSIQTGLFRRQFNFKKLFITRLSVAIAPLVITVPLALYTHSYWSLIIGNLSGAFINSLVLTIMSSWKPSLFYSFELLKNMFSFSFWSLCEGLANWVIFWVDTFIVSHFCSEYYLGIYKNSANMVMSIMGMISASMSPVLLSVLSRVKDDKKTFFELFLSIERVMLYLILPMGIGLFCYRKVATYILFGKQWSEAANIVGGWALMMMCSLAFYSFPAELYKSKGIPKILFFFQISYIIFLVPCCIISIRRGFWIFVYSRCLCVIEQIIMSLIFIKATFNFNSMKLFKNMGKPLLATLIIPTVYVITYRWINISYVHEFLGMLISCFVYLAVVYLFFKRDILSARSRIQKFNV